MAVLKNSLVTGSLRVTDTVHGEVGSFSTIQVPNSSGALTAGSSGEILKTTGTTAYWSSLGTVEFILGENDANGIGLSGETELTSLLDGQVFLYFSPSALSETAHTITLTGPDNSTLASALPLYSYYNVPCIAAFPAYTMIMFAYKNGSFMLVNPPTVY